MKLQLIKLKESHLEKVMRWRMSPEVTRYMFTDPVLTLDTQKEWFKRVSSDPSARYWVINCEGEDIGLACLTNIDWKNKTCTKGYYIGELRYRGRGIASILEYNIYEYVFNCLGLNKVLLEVLACNNRALAIYRKFGCEVKEELYGHVIKNGQKMDVVRLGLLRSKWGKIRAGFKYPTIFIEE